MLGAGEILAVLLQKGLVLPAPHLVNGITQELGDMEFVEGDLLLSAGNMLQGRVDVARSHVH